MTPSAEEMTNATSASKIVTATSLTRAPLSSRCQSSCTISAGVLIQNASTSPIATTSCQSPRKTSSTARRAKITRRRSGSLPTPTPAPASMRSASVSDAATINDPTAGEARAA